MEKNNFEKKNTDLEWIDRRIEEIAKNPITKEKLDALDKNHGKLTKTDYEKLVAETENSRIDLGYLHEYRYLLEKLGYSPEAVNRTLAHENAHGNVATIEGADHQGFSLFIFNDKGILKVRQAAVIKFPKNWSKQEITTAAKKIALAPEIYENQELSDGDKSHLKNE